jgi:hypothetical protein
MEDITEGMKGIRKLATDLYKNVRKLIKKEKLTLRGR